MSRARALLDAEVANSTLVIHLDDRSTDFLKPIYEGHGYPVISGPTTERELRAAIEAHSRCYMLGHGGPGGLFARPFMIDDSFGPLLAAKKEGLYIWCNADAYAVRNKLSGLVSGMFISEVMEARMFGIQATQQEVDASNNLFSRVVRDLLDRGESLANVRQCYTHATCAITKFNNERLYIFENGTPSPALHPTSLGHPRKEYEPSRYSNELAEPGEHYDYEEEWKGWVRDLYKLATEKGFPLNNLSDDEQAALGTMFMDGYKPDEALEEITWHREGGDSTPGLPF